jgi:hypothetical protein
LIAMTPQLAVAGVVANPDYSGGSISLARPSVNTAVARTLRDAMKGQPVKQFPAPNRSIAFGTQVHVPGVTCNSVSTARQKLRSAGFSVVQMDNKVASVCPPGTVANTDPTGSSAHGTPIAIFISNGQGPKPPPGPPGGPFPPGGGGGGTCLPPLPCPPGGGGGGKP